MLAKTLLDPKGVIGPEWRIEGEFVLQRMVVRGTAATADWISDFRLISLRLLASAAPATFCDFVIATVVSWIPNGVMKILSLPLVVAMFAGPALWAAAPNQLSEEELSAGWKLLFDGKTTQGWRSFKKPAFPATGWVAEDGWLHCRGKGGGSEKASAVHA